MRRGYWRTLIRRLRAKVAGGENTFVHKDGVFSISTVTVDDEVVPVEGDVLRLADDDLGNFLILEVSTARVVIVYQGDHRVPAGEDLAAFVDALRSLAPPGLELGPAVDEDIVLPTPRRGIFDGP